MTRLRAHVRSCAASCRCLAAAGPLRAAALAHVGEAHDGLDQVVVGGQFERVDAGAGQRLAQRRSRARRRCGRSACESRRRGCRPRAARRSRRRASVTRPRSGSSSSSGSNRRTATTSWRCASCAERLLPAGLADEVGHHEHGRAALDQRWRPTRAARPAGSCAWRRASARPRLPCACSRCSTWRRPLRGGHHGVDARCRRAARRPGCRAA